MGGGGRGREFLEDGSRGLRIVDCWEKEALVGKSDTKARLAAEVL